MQNIREISLSFPFIVPFLSIPLPLVESSYQFPSKTEQAIFHAITPTSVDFPNESLGKNWQTGWNAKPSPLPPPPPPPCGLSVFREGDKCRARVYTVLNFHPQSCACMEGKKEREGRG